MTTGDFQSSFPEAARLGGRLIDERRGVAQPSVTRLTEIIDWRAARIAISPSSHDADRLWIETEEYDGISRERAAVELTRAQATKLCTALMAWIGGVR